MESVMSIVTRKEVCLAFRAVERTAFTRMQQNPSAYNIEKWEAALAQFTKAQSDWLNGQSTS